MTIVITTNYLDEADQLCDRIAIIDRGEVRAIGSPKDLKASLGRGRSVGHPELTQRPKPWTN